MLMNTMMSQFREKGSGLIIGLKGHSETTLGV